MQPETSQTSPRLSQDPEADENEDDPVVIIQSEGPERVKRLDLGDGETADDGPSSGAYVSFEIKHDRSAGRNRTSGVKGTAHGRRIRKARISQSSA